MGCDQWVEFTLQNKDVDNLTLKDVQLSWGKWYQNGDKSKETSGPADQTIPKEGEIRVASCGRADSPSGTTGSFSLYDGRTMIAKIAWDCPYTGRNTFTVSDVSVNYAVNPSSFQERGALGELTITVVNVYN
ncbi:hypothetical protein BGX26_003312 [Mortierella sp. AD094]|nr:hypothetical protein BGX26_003312 [Mortierella sp. AD094]